MNRQRLRSVDGVVISTPATHTAAPGTLLTQSQPPASNPVANRPYAKPQIRRKRRLLPEYLQLPLIIAAGMLFGILIQSAPLTQAAIVGYGVIAFIRGIPSRITFTFSLLTLLVTVFLLIMEGDTVLSHNFAVYTFLLLVVGVITLNRELKKEGGRLYGIRKIRNY